MQKTQLMAVINITADSFHEGSRTLCVDTAIQRGIAAEKAGADILDIGGESTQPLKYQPTPEDQELSRVIPVIEALAENVSIPISIDTIKPRVAARALEVGASLINDVTGFRHPEMRAVAAIHDCRVCVMHMPQAPYALHVPPKYKGGVVDAILDFFEMQIERLRQDGVRDEQIILDPGTGAGKFGKTVADNLEILQNLHRFKGLGFPVLLGVSRKTFIREILNCTTAGALTGTIALNSLAIERGVDIIRVHDVPEHRHAIDLITALKQAGKHPTPVT